MARFDLAMRSVLWVLEVDVHPVHRTVQGQSDDHHRNRAARKVGYEIEHVGEAALTANFEGEIDALVDSIAVRREQVARLSAAGLWLSR